MWTKPGVRWNDRPFMTTIFDTKAVRASSQPRKIFSVLKFTCKEVIFQTKLHDIAVGCMHGIDRDQRVYRYVISIF
jgi:hypothetical protein